MALGAGSYNSPEIRVIEVFSEGVLCESGAGSFGDLNDGGDIF